MTVDEVAKLFKEKYTLLGFSEIESLMETVLTGLKKENQEGLDKIYNEQLIDLEKVRIAVEEEKKNPVPPLPDGLDIPDRFSDAYPR